MRAELLAWFDRAKRDLPWRRTRDPYAIWVSEVMLQQTQVATVIPYFERFLRRFPTVKALARAPLDDVLSQWKGLGYYSRARNLHRAAGEVVERFGGELPGTAEELRSLPGFGRYTAGAVASIAFGEEAAIVDGNVSRVLARVFGVEGAPGERARDARIWALAEELVRGERPGAFNEALMELGATVCRPEAPACLLCPVRGECVALARGRVEAIPAARVRAARKALRLAVAFVREGERVLVARREAKGLFGGLWELPSVEVAARADAAKALAEALGVRIEEPLGTVQRTLTHRDLTLELFRARLRKKSASAKWATPSEIEKLGMSTAMAEALQFALRAKSPRPSGEG